MSSIDEEKKRQDAAAEHGRELALTMLKSIQGEHASFAALYNAVGNLTVGMFAGGDLPRHHALEEFDNWVKYTRNEIVRAP
jgi:hypothetical protein